MVNIREFTLIVVFSCVFPSISYALNDACSSVLDEIFTSHFIRSQDIDRKISEREKSINIVKNITERKEKTLDCEILEMLPDNVKASGRAIPPEINFSLSDALLELKKAFASDSFSEGDEGIVREGDILVAKSDQIVVYKKNWYKRKVSYPVQEWLISFNPKDLSNIYFDRNMRALVVESKVASIKEEYWEDEDKKGKDIEYLDYSVLAIYIAEEKGQNLAGLLKKIRDLSQ